MAKNAGRLAGLAALAGAAYMMSKGKDKEAGTTDSNPTRAARPDSTEERLKTPAESIAAADKSDKSTSISTKGASGTTTPGPDTSVPKLDTEINKPVKPASAPAPAPASAPAAGSAPATTPMASTADRTDQLAGLSRAVKREDATKKAAQGDFKDVSRVPKNDSPAAIKAKKMYDTMSEKSGAGTSSAQKTDALAVASRAARAANAKRRAATQSAYKKGGMTSTASSASKRADGIASKGKTKCKMY